MMTLHSLIRIVIIRSYVFQALEALLPPRPKVEIPTGDNVEEVSLMEFEQTRSGGSNRGRGEIYDDDDDDEDGGAGPRVQCAHQ